MSKEVPIKKLNSFQAKRAPAFLLEPEQAGNPHAEIFEDAPAVETKSPQRQIVDAWFADFPWGSECERVMESIPESWQITFRDLIRAEHAKIFGTEDFQSCESLNRAFCDVLDSGKLDMYLNYADSEKGKEAYEKELARQRMQEVAGDASDELAEAGWTPESLQQAAEHQAQEDAQREVSIAKELDMKDLRRAVVQQRKYPKDNFYIY